MIIMKERDKSYRLGVLSVCIGYALCFVPIIALPEIIYALVRFISFGLLGFAYKTILIRKNLHNFFVVFGGLAVVLFLGLMLAQLSELVYFLLEGIF